jgi:hypothetical protein
MLLALHTRCLPELIAILEKDLCDFKALKKVF